MWNAPLGSRGASLIAYSMSACSKISFDPGLRYVVDSCFILVTWKEQVEIILGGLLLACKGALQA